LRSRTSVASTIGTPGGLHNRERCLPWLVRRYRSARDGETAGFA